MRARRLVRMDCIVGTRTSSPTHRTDATGPEAGVGLYCVLSCVCVLCVVSWLFRAEAGLGQCLVIVRANVRRLRMSCDADALLRDRRVCVV